MLRRLIVVAVLLALPLAVQAGDLQRDLKSRWLGAWIVTTTEDAVNGLLSSYDEETDTTLIEIDGEEVVTLNGDQTGLSIAFHDDVDGDQIWLDIEGNPISAEEGASADIILCARDLQDVVGEIS